jgi:DNA-nicking Smr family endonuclease
MARKTAVTDDEAIAFAEAMRGAKGLSGPPRVECLPRCLPAATAVHGSGGLVARGKVGARPALAASATMFAPSPGDNDEEAWRIRGDGVDTRAMKRLRNGQFPIEARIDLHGLTRARAEHVVERFLAAARSSQRRGLLIIHGRGLHSGAAGPTLRAVVRQALSQGEHAAAVLAATSPAPTALGGAGATLVWMRKS